MKYTNLPEANQRTKDWRIERLGCWTGSEIVNLMKRGRKATETFGDTAKDYIYAKMAERSLNSHTIGDEDTWQQYLSLTGISSKVMQFGIDNEDDAIAGFESWLAQQEELAIDGVTYKGTDLYVARTGSIAHVSIPNLSASPDAVVVRKSDDEIVAAVECKVPLPKTFVRYKNEIKDAETLKSCMEAYYYQTHAEMMVTQTKACFFVTYQPFLIGGFNVVLIGGINETMIAIMDRILLAERLINKIEKGYGGSE